jgi:hypothetical protein
MCVLALLSLLWPYALLIQCYEEILNLLHTLNLALFL